MTENEFEKLWQRAEGENYGQRLAEGYGEWNQRQRRIKSVVVASMLVAAVSVPLFSSLHQPSQEYAKVYCNRTGTSEAQWDSLASEMLMEL